MERNINSDFTHHFDGHRIQSSRLRSSALHLGLRKDLARESFSELASSGVGNTHEEEVHVRMLRAGVISEQGCDSSEIHNELDQEVVAQPVGRRVHFIGELIHVAEFEPQVGVDRVIQSHKSPVLIKAAIE